MAEFIQPFDFKKILIEYLLGSQELLVMGITIVISFLCAYFSIPTKVYAIILILSLIIFAQFIGVTIYILILIIVGYIVFKGFARLFT